MFEFPFFKDCACIYFLLNMCSICSYKKKSEYSKFRHSSGSEAAVFFNVNLCICIYMCVCLYTTHKHRNKRTYNHSHMCLPPLPPRGCESGKGVPPPPNPRPPPWELPRAPAVAWQSGQNSGKIEPAVQISCRSWKCCWRLLRRQGNLFREEKRERCLTNFTWHFFHDFLIWMNCNKKRLFFLHNRTYHSHLTSSN